MLISFGDRVILFFAAKDRRHSGALLNSTQICDASSLQFTQMQAGRRPPNREREGDGENRRRSDSDHCSKSSTPRRRPCQSQSAVSVSRAWINAYRTESVDSPSPPIACTATKRYLLLLLLLLRLSGKCNKCGDQLVVASTIIHPSTQSLQYLKRI